MQYAVVHIRETTHSISRNSDNDLQVVLKPISFLPGKYIKKSCEVAVAQTQKRCNIQEKDMKEEIEKLRHKVDEETRVNAEIESYLRTHQTVR